MTRYWLIFFLLLTSLYSQAQGPKKPALRLDLTAGAVGGAALPAVQAQLTGGLEFRNFFIGAGTGMDRYEQNSLPLFFHLQGSLRKAGSSPFLFASGGYNFPKQEKGFHLEDLRGGHYFDMGIGYRVRFKKSIGLIMSAGYTGKSFSHEYTQPIFCPGGCNPSVGSAFTYRYRFTRFGFRAGISIH